MSKKNPPSMDEWLREAKADEKAARCGMFLVHNGVVRESAKVQVRSGKTDAPAVTGMNFSFDAAKVDAAVADALAMPGIFLVKVWLNEGLLTVGDDIMFVLVGGDIRPHVIDALQALVGEIKNHCVLEEEIY
ncbi:MAG: molybdenum cofactor biosynthesis protein MoaE [Oscillospiraceae bacterium]|nr:molybdenum cofactor biosynthesis protein MoaE [Oscillospiraceae bacterium]